MSDHFLAGQNLLRQCIKKTFRTSVSDRVRQLLADGADPDFSGQGTNPLCEACKSGNLAVIKILLNHGSSVDIQNEDGDTPLHLAVSSSINLSSSAMMDVLQHLVQHGACINMNNNQGQSPLMIAAKNMNWDFVKYLKRRSCQDQPAARNMSKDAARNMSECVFYDLMVSHFEDVGKFLIQHGANVNIPYEGKPWIHHLLAQKKLELANLVLQAGLSPYYSGSIHVDTDDFCPFHEYDIDYELEYKPPHQDVNVFWRSYLHQLSTAGFDISIESVELFDIRHLCVPSHPFLSHYEYLSGTFSDVKMLEQFLPQREKTVPGLYQACRTRIRHELAFSKIKGHIIQKIDSLSLPAGVKSYLKLEDTPSINDQLGDEQDEYVVPIHKMCCYIL